MKLDNVRVQQNDFGRTDLNAQQWNTPSTHSTSMLELTDAELETVYGGWHEDSEVHDRHIHSFAVICDINVFSLNVNVLNVIRIGTAATQVCVSRD